MTGILDSSVPVRCCMGSLWFCHWVSVVLTRILHSAGNARVKDCLEEHRDDAEFSSECKVEFETMMEARAADFRLDSSLREKCADDIEDVCGYEKVGSSAWFSDINCSHI